jgi:predicted acetylornithine/succinylornithine family transaminase
LKSRTEELIEWANAHATPSYAPPPFVVSHGEGCRLFDLDGNRYLDFASGIGVTAVGHAHPRVVAAVASQAGKICHTSGMLLHAGYAAVCRRITDISFAPRVFLGNSGAEAGEAAMKLARRYFYDQGEMRTGFVATHGSFHGRTYGALTLTGQPKYQTGLAPLLPDVSHVPYGDLDAMKKAVGASTAAVIVEPIQGNAGVRVAPDGYLAGLSDICNAAGCLLVFDEVQTGIGRTGKWFAYEHDGVAPDIMTLAKGLGGGLPLGAMATTEELGQTFQVGVHASTFGGNPVACAAGLATLDIIRDDGLLENADRIGETLVSALRALGHPSIHEIRSRGLMIGIELDRPAGPLKKACLERGLLANLAGDSVLRLLPPLIIGEPEVDEAVGIIEAALAAS